MVWLREQVAEMTLQQVLKVPELVAALRVSAAEEFAEENVFFVEDVLEMKEKKDAHRIRELVAEYIAPEAQMEINISHEARQKIMENVADAITNRDMSLFDGALEEVMQMISTTILVRFRETFGRGDVQPKVELPEGVKRVVIIGGGFVGLGCARALDHMPRFHITLIDTKAYWEFTPALVHAQVDPSFADGFRVEHKEYVKNGKVVTATVTDVTDKIVVADGNEYPYDYLVIASGSSYRSQLLKGRNMSTSYRMKRINNEFNMLKGAKDVLIIGGGVVGVELAAEIACSFPDKHVTIVEANKTLIKRTPPRAQELCRRALERMGVQIIFNERILQVSSEDHRTYITNKGRSVQCDKAYVATGPKPVSDFFRKHFPDCVSDAGFVKVTETLQVPGHPNIFSGGDVCSLVHEKLAMTATMHGVAIARNICRIEKGRPTVKLGTHGIPASPMYPKHLFIMLANAGALYVYKGKRTFMGQFWTRFPFERDAKFMLMARGQLPVNYTSLIARPPRTLGLPPPPKNKKARKPAAEEQKKKEDKKKEDNHLSEKDEIGLTDSKTEAAIAALAH